MLVSLFCGQLANVVKGRRMVESKWLENLKPDSLRERNFRVSLTRSLTIFDVAA
jgi:hypothetical protein